MRVLAMTSDNSNRADQKGPSSENASSIQPYKEAKTFRDLNGAQWFVHEVSGDALGGGHSCLLLVSAEQVRRVVSYPANWLTLSPATLLELPHTPL